MRRGGPDDPGEWTGSYVRYDLIKELVVALVVITALALVLSILFSSPDDKPLTIQSWAQADPGNFLSTANSELDGSSDLAGYGPPYNHTSDAGQKIGPVSLQRAAGVHEPIDSANDLVINPLKSIPGNVKLAAALRAYQAASPDQQMKWTDAFDKAVDKAKFKGALVTLPKGDYGPVAPMMGALLGLARSGGLDGALLATKQFYSTDYARPLLFLGDGGDDGYFASAASDQHLLGSQWGMMNETGSYPGQVWLWLYTFWYQISPFTDNTNADAQIWLLMAILSLAFICIPIIPGLRTLPRHLRVYRLIWRDHYRREER